MIRYRFGRFVCELLQRIVSIFVCVCGEMGCSQSYPGLTEDVMEDYTTLTYLSKGEILYLMKKFYSIGPAELDADSQHRFAKEEVVQKFNVLKNSPFQDRLFHVFSSKNDGCFSFEDLLDMCSAMSAQCPPEVKAAWAFQVYDLDDDKQISARDVIEILDRLLVHPQGVDLQLDIESKTKIADTLLEEIKLDNSGGIGLSEFKMIMARLPEFQSSFYFRV